MTDKEIIVNDVDVNECRYSQTISGNVKCECEYEAFNGEIETFDECKNYPTCYYKQLKRKEQELRNICKAFDIEYVIDKETGSLIGRCNKLNKKEQECEELREQLSVAQERYTTIRSHAIELADTKLKLQKELNKYKQALDEIEECCKQTCRLRCTNDCLGTRKHCGYGAVLNIINKVKEGNNNG